MQNIAESMVCYSGRVWDGEGFSEGYVIAENGRIVEVGDGSPSDAVHVGCIMPGLTDGHTHVGDAGLKLDRRYSLEELVAPPEGLKHRYLSSTPPGKLESDMASYAQRLVSGGVSRFLDFREGGVSGASMLRRASDRAVVLGRPVSASFDPNEMDDLLDVADGIGISSITDIPDAYTSAMADAVHRKGGFLGIHVSERIREDIDRVLALEPDFVVHMCEATDADMRRCADAGVPVVVCASSNLYFGKVPPIGRMCASGMGIAVGTDNAMLAPPDMFAEARVLRDISTEQGCTADVAERALTAGGYKLLLTKRAIGIQTGAEDFVVTCDDICDGLFRDCREG